MKYVRVLLFGTSMAAKAEIVRCLVTAWYNPV